MTPEQLTALGTEVQKDPQGLGYAEFLPKCPGSVADLLNSPTQKMLQAVTAAMALSWAAKGPYARIIDAGKNVDHPCRASCLAIRDAVLAGLTIDLSQKPIQDMFAAWLATDLIKQEEYDSLLLAAQQPASRAKVLGFVSVTEADLRDAGVL